MYTSATGIETGFNPELKNYYSRRLLERLVPALQHAGEPIILSEWEQEWNKAVQNWVDYFNGTIRQERVTTPALG